MKSSWEKQLEELRWRAKRSEGRKWVGGEAGGSGTDAKAGSKQTHERMCAKRRRRSLSRQFIKFHLIKIKGNWGGGCGELGREQ